MQKPNYALYYPNIEFRDYASLWSAALLWDRIYRIVPQGYEPLDCENVRIMRETGEIGAAIPPDAYTKDVANEFLDQVATHHWTATALKRNLDSDYVRLHRDKVDVELRNMMIAAGTAREDREWLRVPRTFEALYMTYLAGRISARNDLQLISDNAGAWTGATYFAYDGAIEDRPLAHLPQQLATLVIRDFVPANILDVRPDQLVSFREKYRDERQRFLSAVGEAAKTISACEDPDVYNDRIDDLKKEIEISLCDYRRSLEALHVTSLTGIQSLQFPVLTTIATVIAGGDLSATTLAVQSALGFAVGLVSGLVGIKHQRRRLEKESDFSYLLHLKRDLQQGAAAASDHVWRLRDSMHQFIYD